MTFQFQCPRGHLLEGEPSQAGQQCNCPTCGMLFIIPAPLPSQPPGGAGAPTQPTAPADVPPTMPSAPTQSTAPHAAAPQYAMPPTHAAPPAGPPPTPSPTAGFPAAPGPPTHSIAPGSPTHAAVPGPTGNVAFDSAAPAVPGPASSPTSDPRSATAAAFPQVDQVGPQGGGAAGPEVPFPTNPTEMPEQQEELLHIPCPQGHELETPRDMLDQEVMCPYCNVQFRLREKDSVEFKRRRSEEIDRKERKRGTAWFNWAIVAAVLVILGIAFLIFSSSG